MGIAVLPAPGGLAEAVALGLDVAKVDALAEAVAIGAALAEADRVGEAAAFDLELLVPGTAAEWGEGLTADPTEVGGTDFRDGGTDDLIDDFEEALAAGLGRCFKFDGGLGFAVCPARVFLARAARAACSAVTVIGPAAAPVEAARALLPSARGFI